MLPISSRKARQWRAFAIRRPVSVLPISWTEAQIRGKSLANTANIPVFGRLRPETRFDLHCVAGLTVQTHQILRLCRQEIGNSEPPTARRGRQSISRTDKVSNKSFRVNIIGARLSSATLKRSKDQGVSGARALTTATATPIRNVESD